MNVITITRQYGAGGGEIGRCLAERLGWELLDRELLHRAAEIEHLPDAELERWDEKGVSVVERLRLHPPHQQYLHGLTQAVEQAASRGRVVLVGRGARNLVPPSASALHLRLVAPKDWRARRMTQLLNVPIEESLARCAQMEQSRDRFLRYFFGSQATLSREYDLVFNTGRVPLENVVSAVASLVREETPPAEPASLRRVLTISRELGAGEQTFAPVMAQRLGMQSYDREFLEQEAARLGLPESQVEKIDEHPPGILPFRAGSIASRYLETVKQLMAELAQRGEVIVVGRGGAQLLHEEPRAFHVRLVAAIDVRVRRVMEYHWVRENIARKLIAESDAQRRSFYRAYFSSDWESPLEYDLSVNVGRLGPVTVEAVAQAATRHWNRCEVS